MGRIKLVSLLKKLCVFHIERRILHNILLEDEVTKEERGEGILEAGRADSLKEKILIIIAYVAIERDMMHPHVCLLGTKFRRK